MDLADALGLEGRVLVAFVGAGGKKTAMGHLATAAGNGRKVGYTTTTHMPPPRDIPLVLVDADGLADVPAGTETPVAVAAERVTDPDRADEKVRGYDPETVADLHTSGRFDWLLVKADGARRREFKAPGPAEPAVPPAATHVVPVASVKIVGEPLAAPLVHRPERVAAITDTGINETVTPTAIGTVLSSVEGGLKRVPPDARVIPMVNKADTPAEREDARQALRIALDTTSRLERGLVTSFEEEYCEVVERQSASRL